MSKPKVWAVCKTHPGKNLEIDDNSVYPDQKITIQVEPCPKCISEAAKEVFKTASETISGLNGKIELHQDKLLHVTEWLDKPGLWIFGPKAVKRIQNAINNIKEFLNEEKS